MRLHHAIVVLALLPVFGSSQVVPAGSTPDEVVRALGSPRSRSATKGREIWLYADHQAVFENGRLLSLVALPDEGGNVAWQKLPRVPESSSAVSGSAGMISSGAASGAVILKRDAGKTVLRTPERASPPPAPERGGGSFATFMSGVLVGLGLAGAALWYRHRRASGSAVTPPSSTGGTETGDAPGASVPTPILQNHRPQFNSESKPPTLADWELTPELLHLMEWKRFELLVQRYFTASGLRPRTHVVGSDGGIELFLYRGQATRPFRYVQCCAGSDHCTDGRVVRELFANMAENRIGEGMIVTTGTVTPEAEKFGRQNRISILSASDFASRFNQLPQMVRARILTDVTAGDYMTPSCPRCNVKLMLRESETPGVPIWGCRRFPHCRFTMKPRATAVIRAVTA
jgi:hypothetical protein